MLQSASRGDVPGPGGGVPGSGGGGVPGPGGGGVPGPGGVHGPRRGVPACTEADTLPPPVDRILDTRWWKYYLGPTSLRLVKIQKTSFLSFLMSNLTLRRLNFTPHKIISHNIKFQIILLKNGFKSMSSKALVK